MTVQRRKTAHLQALDLVHEDRAGQEEQLGQLCAPHRLGAKALKMSVVYLPVTLKSLAPANERTSSSHVGRIDIAGRIDIDAYIFTRNRNGLNISIFSI